MRVVLDTNILVSALLVQSGVPGKIYTAWLEGDFTLLISRRQIIELRSTLRKPKIAARLRPREVGSLINNLNRLAETVDRLPHVARSSDPEDDFSARNGSGRTGALSGNWRQGRTAVSRAARRHQNYFGKRIRETVPVA